jgi:crotonobetainyl-CoA:carnitine CoA-transferase CaiB-like acyl-CoA transferase
MIANWMAERPASEVVHVLATAGVPAAVVNTIADVMGDPQIEARHNFTRLADPVLGDVVMATPTPQLSRTPGSIRSTAPRPGENNREIYGALLGVSSDAMTDLSLRKII